MHRLCPAFVLIETHIPLYCLGEDGCSLSGQEMEILCARKSHRI